MPVKETDYEHLKTSCAEKGKIIIRYNLILTMIEYLF